MSGEMTSLANYDPVNAPAWDLAKYTQPEYAYSPTQKGLSSMLDQSLIDFGPASSDSAEVLGQRADQMSNQLNMQGRPDNMFDKFSKFGSGIMSLAGAWNAMQQLGLLKDQFDFAKKDRRNSVKNQAIVTNEALKGQTSTRAQLHGKKYGSLAYNQAVANGPQVSGKI